MFFRQSADPSHTIVLAGSGRSGTTWVGNIISANPNVRVIFEPFDYRRVPEAASMPLRPYASPNGSYPEWASLVGRVLSGNIHNAWVDREGRRPWAQKRLVKEIRATLMLGWMDSTFHPRIGYIIRHPCAVVLSRMKLGWETHLDAFLSQSELVTDYLDPYVDVIVGARTEVEKQAVMWCVENLVPLRQLPEYKWAFYTYEELYRNRADEVQRMLGQLGIHPTWFTQRAIKRVTRTTRADSAVLSGADPLAAWQSDLSHDDIRTIIKIVQTFGINLYDEGVLPNTEQFPHFARETAIRGDTLQIHEDSDANQPVSANR